MKKRALILGGNRFFGRHLTLSLLDAGFEVTLLNRGRFDDGLGNRVSRLKADRKNPSELSAALGTNTWDFVFDQICFTATEATTICENLKGRAGKVLFTSSQSVYGFGFSLPEESFDPYQHQYSKEVTPDEDYSEAKRQAETAFAKFPELRPVMARMPLVIGSDDYTGRFSWHIQRCEKGLPIYFPNDQARMGYIRSDFAGQALHKIMESDLIGPVNCACPGEISLSGLMSLIEKYTGRSYVRATEASNETHSPYGVPSDWTMSLDKLKTHGIVLPHLDSWLSDLVIEESKKARLTS